MTGLTAELVDPPLVPGSPEWRKEITASKVSAILGLSPWQSRFSMYYDLAGMLPHDDMTPNQARGHYLEEAVCQWFADQYSVYLRPGRCWRSVVHPWMVASPDRLAYPNRYARRAHAVVEAKTAGDYGDWGGDGGDDIPPHYRAQVVWQLDTLGLKVGHVAVLLPRLSFRAYTINHDQDEADWMRQEVLTFLDTLPGGPNEQVPDIDTDDSTYKALRQLNPAMEEDVEVPVTLELAQRFIGTYQQEKDSKEALVGVKSEMAQIMGTAKKAVLLREGRDPLVIATRQQKGGGLPYVAAPRTLPTWEDLLV